MDRKPLCCILSLGPVLERSLWSFALGIAQPWSRRWALLLQIDGHKCATSVFAKCSCYHYLSQLYKSANAPIVLKAAVSCKGSGFCFLPPWAGWEMHPVLPATGKGKV